MSTLDQLASSLGRRDEAPNLALAKTIAAKKDKEAVKELIDSLAGNNKDIQSDSIKVLYEIGSLHPPLIAGYCKDLVKLLDSKNNRLQWGAMTALNTIVAEKPELIFESLPKLVAIAEKGSVITRDNLMAILVQLCAVKKHADAAFALFNEQLKRCPGNQVPMYAENALPVISDKNKTIFVQTLTARLDDLEKESKQKRVEKVIKKVINR